MPSTAKPSVGFASILGALMTMIAAAGAIVAAIKANDTATIAGSATALLAAVATLGGRFAQAVALIRRVAPAAAVVVADAATITEAIAKGLAQDVPGATEGVKAPERYTDTPDPPAATA